MSKKGVHTEMTADGRKYVVPTSHIVGYGQEVSGERTTVLNRFSAFNCEAPFM